jgi:hypothetical protein
MLRGGKAAEVDAGSTWDEGRCGLFQASHDKDVG